MPKRKTKKKDEVQQEEETEKVVEEPKETEAEEEIQKTSIAISTRVRDRLWKLKFRKTYDEFLWELCEMYEKQVGAE